MGTFRDFRIWDRIPMSSLLCAALTLLVPTPPHVRNTIHSQCHTAPIIMLENDLFDSPLPLPLAAVAACSRRRAAGEGTAIVHGIHARLS